MKRSFFIALVAVLVFGGLSFALATSNSSAGQQDNKTRSALKQKQSRKTGGKAKQQSQAIDASGHTEQKGDPYLKGSAKRRTTPGMISFQNSVLSVQVNVDAQGNNILGDAANEPSIAVNPLNRNQMAIGWRQFDTVLSNFRQAGHGYTTDGGATWTFPGVFEPGVFRSDPVLAFDAQGNFVYNSLTTGPFTCWGFNSSDGGINWSAPVFAWGGDKQWMTIDRTNGIGSGNIYLDWSPFFTPHPGFFSRSVDGGLSYEAPIILPFELFWGTLNVGPAGELYICGTLNSGQPIVIKSTDAQNPVVTPTFPDFALVDLGGVIEISEGPNPSGLLGQFWVATDHSGRTTHGNVYMLGSVNPPGDDPLDIGFSRSTDGGQSWSAPIRLNDDAQQEGAYQWFGTMAVAPNGRIDAIWNDSRDDTTTPFMSAMYYTNSVDGGLTWSAQVPVTTPWNPLIGHPNQAKIGDYYDMVSDNCGVNIAYAATFNGEQDVYHMRIELGDQVNPEANKILDGVLDSGELSDVFLSDDQYMEFSPSPTNNPLKQKVEMIVQSTSPVESPGFLCFTLEAKMLAAQLPGDVIQSVELFDYATGRFEVVDVRPADDDDMLVDISPVGDVSRFVQPGTREVTANLTWKSESFSGPTFDWTIDIDQSVWMLAE